MGIFNFVTKLFSGKVPSYSPEYEYFKKMYPNWDSKNRQETMEKIGIVYRCVKAISDDISSIDWKVYKYVKNEYNRLEKEPVDTKLLNTFLSKPHPDLTMQELIWNVVANMNLVGEGILVKKKTRRKINGESVLFALEPLNPVNWSLELDPNTNRPKQWVHIRNKERVVRYSDTLHFKFSNPKNIYRGLAPMSAAQLASQNALYAAEFNRNFYFNSANPSGAFILPDGVALNQEQFKRLQNQINKAYTGMKNTGRPLVLEKGMKFEKIQITHQELEYAANRIEDNKEVGLVFGVPEAKLYGTSATYASSIQAEKDYTKNTLLPIAKIIKSVLNRGLLNEFVEDRDLFIDFENFVPEDMQFQVSKDVRLVKSGIITPNEARVNQGYPRSKDPKADELYLTYLETDFDNNQEPDDKNTTQM